jgi:hypothetical protein
MVTKFLIDYRAEFFLVLIAINHGLAHFHISVPHGYVVTIAAALIVAGHRVLAAYPWKTESRMRIFLTNLKVI